MVYSYYYDIIITLRVVHTKPLPYNWPRKFRMGFNFHESQPFYIDYVFIVFEKDKCRRYILRDIIILYSKQF